MSGNKGPSGRSCKGLCKRLGLQPPPGPFGLSKLFRHQEKDKRMSVNRFPVFSEAEVPQAICRGMGIIVSLVQCHMMSCRADMRKAQHPLTFGSTEQVTRINVARA